MKFLQNLIFKNDFWVQRVATDGGSRVLINPAALLGAYEIDKIAKFLLPLQCKKRPTRINPGGHDFVFLNVSINKKPFFVSEGVLLNSQLLSL
jgi:hypothetical protein